ncbi:MAG TPA: phage tail tube protein [Tepidisphaeraceae bacterium]|jgi:hypothetical protein|nr:phage tail tube protein [Tepidisphaeraceae bacterium]
MSTATKAFGSKLSFCTTVDGTYTKIAQTKDLAMPSPEIGEIEITNDDSPNNAKEYLGGGGLIEPGELEFATIYNKAGWTALYTMFGDGENYFWEEEFKDGAKYRFEGYLKNIGGEGETVDGVYEGSLTIKLTTAPTYIPGT